MDLSGLNKPPRVLDPTPVFETSTAIVVRADASGLWVAPLGEDPRHPVGPCRGGWTGSGDLPPAGALVLLAQTPDGPWVVGLADARLVVDDSTSTPFTNASFELVDQAGKAVGWSDFWSSARSDTYTLTVESISASHGMRCLRVDTTTDEVAILNSSIWSVPAGSTVEVSLDARGLGVAPVVRANLWSNTADGDPGPFSPGAAYNTQLIWQPNGDWLRVRGNITIPPTHTRVRLFFDLGSSTSDPATVWIDNVDADVVNLDPAAEHSDWMRRAAATLTGGGIRAVTLAGHVSWSAAFTIAATGATPATAPDGRFEISMPPAGTVIPVHSSDTRISHTVAGGVIALAADEALWYELPIGQAAASQPDRFHILATSLVDGFDPPPHWLLVVRRGTTPPEFTWGDQQPMDPWRPPTLNSGWAEGTVPPRYRREGDTVRLVGRVKSGTGSAFTLPPGFRPAVTHDDVVRDGAGAPAALTITPAGVVTTSGSNTDHRVSTTFPAEQ